MRPRSRARYAGSFSTKLVLREYEGLSYHELEKALEIPWEPSCRGVRAGQALRDALDSEANASLATEYSNTS